MSLGHWCHVCTVACSLAFCPLSWNMPLCRISFFWTKGASNWSTWNCLNSLNVFCLKQSLTRITVHCRALLPDHCRALYGNCDCRNWWKEWSALSCHWPRTDWLPSGKIQPAGGKRTESARTGLRECFCHWTLAEFEAAEINDLLLVTQAITAVRAHCETLKSTAVSQEWLPSTAVPGSMTDGLYGLRYANPSPDSPCNCFSLAALHSRRCQNWQALKNAETLFPNCKMPHSSYTLAEFNCSGNCGPDTVEIMTGLAFKDDVVTTGQTAQSMCFATSLRPHWALPRRF